MNLSDSLTPIAATPLPFDDRSSIPVISSITAPMISMIDLPVVSFPTVSSTYVQLPTVSSVPLVTFPNLSIPQSTILSDNQIGSLRWNKPNPPYPREVTSSYRRVGCIGDGGCFFHVVAKGLSENYRLTYRDFNNISEKILRDLENAVQNVIIFPSTLFTTPRIQNLGQIYSFAQPYGYTTFKDLMYKYRLMYVKLLRQDFAYQILNDKRMQNLVLFRLSGSIDLQIDNLIESYKQTGHFATQSKIQQQAFQNVLQNLAHELLSGNAVQPDFMLLLSDYSDIDIYLLRDTQLTNPDPAVSILYGGAALHAAVHGPINMRPNGDIFERERERPAIVIIAVDDIHYEIVARIDETEDIDKKRDIIMNMTQDEPLIRRLYEVLVNLRYSV
jgi:hypothetical protein